MNPNISAIICTYNRPKELRMSIKSLLNQSLPRTMYEIVVVDNSLNKSAYDIVEGFKDAGNVRYIHEPTVGLSRARNAGLKIAYGEYVAYIDDDATADPEWLANMREAFKESNTDCVGGRIDVALENSRPEWLVDELLFCLGRISCSETSLVVNKTDHYLHGGNIAFKKEVLERYGGFSTNLGRSGENLISCEEILVQKKMRRDGRVCLYHPDVIVQHHIKKERLTKDWFLRRMYAEGFSFARMQMSDEYLPMSKRLSLAMYKLVHIFKNNGSDSFARKCRMRKDLGFIVGLLSPLTIKTFE